MVGKKVSGRSVKKILEDIVLDKNKVNYIGLEMYLRELYSVFSVQNGKSVCSRVLRALQVVVHATC